MCLKCPPYILKHNYFTNETFCELCGESSTSWEFKKCDFEGCKNTFHRACVNKMKMRDFGPFSFMEKWECSCHSCLSCGSKENLRQCYRCMTCYCQKHARLKIFKTPDNRLACELHHFTFLAEPWRRRALILSNMTVLQIAIEYFRHSVDSSFKKHVKKHRLNVLALKVLQIETKFLRNNLFLPMELKKRILVDIHEIGNLLWDYLSIHESSDANMGFNWYAQLVMKNVFIPIDRTEKVLSALRRMREVK